MIRSKLIHREELGIVTAFFITGFLSTFLLIVFLACDVYYSSSSGTEYKITKDSIVLGVFASIFIGLLLPLVCFWFKYVHWCFAWFMMLLIALTVAFFIWHYEKRPASLMQRYLGNYADIVQVNRMIEYNRYESSGVYFELSGDTVRFHNAMLKAISPTTLSRFITVQINGVKREILPLAGVPEQYSIYIENWESVVLAEWESFVTSK